MAIKVPKWVNSLSTVSWVNSVAISNDGSRVVGGTFVHDYPNKERVFARFGTFCYDSAGNQLWSKTFRGLDGVFAVGISGDGTIAAGGGLFTPPGQIQQATGLVTIFDAQNGNVLFDSPVAMPANPVLGRVNVLSLSGSGQIVAAAADQLYVFIKSGGAYAPIASSAPAGDPDFRTALGKVSAVSVAPAGNWLAACNQAGEILVATIAGGAINRTFLVKVNDEPIRLASNLALKAPVRFFSIAIAGQADVFVAGGSDVVYRGSLSDVTTGQPLVRYDAGDANAAPGSLQTDPVTMVQTPLANPNVRWATISGNGAKFAVVANRVVNGKGTGQLLIFNAGTFVPAVKAALPHNPNGVSMDRAATFVAVSDGYPVGKPATFYRFDFSGNEVWHCPTPDMNWPVAVSADGSAIAGGGDDGFLYYLVP